MDFTFHVQIQIVLGIGNFRKQRKKYMFGQIQAVITMKFV